MTWQTNDLRIIDPLLTATKRGFGIEIEEPVKRRDHSMVNIVFLPTLMIGGLVYLGVMGALLSVFGAAMMWFGWSDNRALLIVFGLPWAPACRFSFQRLTAQLDIWHDLQYRVLRARVDDDTSTTAPAQIERVDPGHLIGLRAPWVSGWKQKLAHRVYNQHGRWVGGDKLVRDRHLEGLCRSLSTNFNNKKIQDDLQRLEWIDLDDKWTDKGQADIKGYLFYGGNDE